MRRFNEIQNTLQAKQGAIFPLKNQDGQSYGLSARFLNYTGFVEIDIVDPFPSADAAYAAAASVNALLGRDDKDICRLIYQSSIAAEDDPNAVSAENMLEHELAQAHNLEVDMPAQAMNF